MVTKYNSHLQNTSQVPSTVLSIFYDLTHLIGMTFNLHDYPIGKILILSS